jgi:hypothetical protein
VKQCASEVKAQRAIQSNRKSRQKTAASHRPACVIGRNKAQRSELFSGIEKAGKRQLHHIGWPVLSAEIKRSAASYLVA